MERIKINDAPDTQLIVRQWHVAHVFLYHSHAVSNVSTNTAGGEDITVQWCHWTAA